VFPRLPLSFFCSSLIRTPFVLLDFSFGLCSLSFSPSALKSSMPLSIQVEISSDPPLFPPPPLKTDQLLFYAPLKRFLAGSPLIPQFPRTPVLRALSSQLISPPSRCRSCPLPNYRILAVYLLPSPAGSLSEPYVLNVRDFFNSLKIHASSPLSPNLRPTSQGPMRKSTCFRVARDVKASKVVFFLRNSSAPLFFPHPVPANWSRRPRERICI